MSRPFRERVGDSTSEQIEFIRRMYEAQGSQNYRRRNWKRDLLYPIAFVVLWSAIISAVLWLTHN